MLQRILRSIAPLLLLAASSLAGGENWSQLKIGMSADEAAEALGAPLIKTVGGGFELWIYDNNAEAVFYGGPLVAWTTPGKGAVVGRAVDVWQRKPGVAGSPVFILPRSLVPSKQIARRQDEGVYTLPFYRLRN